MQGLWELCGGDERSDIKEVMLLQTLQLGRLIPSYTDSILRQPHSLAMQSRLPQG